MTELEKLIDITTNYCTEIQEITGKLPKIILLPHGAALPTREGAIWINFYMEDKDGNLHDISIQRGVSNE